MRLSLALVFLAACGGVRRCENGMIRKETRMETIYLWDPNLKTMTPRVQTKTVYTDKIGECRP